MGRSLYERALGEAAVQGDAIANQPGKLKAFAQGKLRVHWPDITKGAVMAITNAGGSVGRDNVIRLKGGKVASSRDNRTFIRLPTGVTIWVSEYEVGTDR